MDVKKFYIMSKSNTLYSRRSNRISPTLLLIRSQDSTPEPSPVARSVSPSKASTKGSTSRTGTPIHKRLAELRTWSESDSQLELPQNDNKARSEISPISVIIHDTSGSINVN